MENSNIVEIAHLKVALGGVPVLHDVNLSLRRGEIYGLLGPNGAGKSTTIAAATGLLHRDGGEILVLGKDPMFAPKRIHPNLGVLPEQNGFYDWMTATDYLTFFAALYGLHPRERELRKMLRRFGLTPRPGQRIGTFSRGMRQRLGLARALIAKPRLLILDEPTNGLDPRGRREIHDILIDLSTNHGVGILLCTHLLDDVERLCERIGVMVAGRSVAEGRIVDLVNGHGHRSRFRIRLNGNVPMPETPAAVTVVSRYGEWWTVDLAPGIEPETAWRNLLFMGWPITEIRHERGGIEDFYLSLADAGSA